MNFIQQLIDGAPFKTKQKLKNNKKMDVTEKNINPKIGLIVGNDWLKQCDRIPKVEQRVSPIYIFCI